MRAVSDLCGGRNDHRRGGRPQVGRLGRWRRRRSDGARRDRSENRDRGRRRNGRGHGARGDRWCRSGRGGPRKETFGDGGRIEGWNVLAEMRRNRAEVQRLAGSIAVVQKDAVVDRDRVRHVTRRSAFRSPGTAARTSWAARTQGGPRRGQREAPRPSQCASLARQSRPRAVLSNRLGLLCRPRARPRRKLFAHKPHRAHPLL